MKRSLALVLVLVVSSCSSGRGGRGGGGGGGNLDFGGGNNNNGTDGGGNNSGTDGGGNNNGTSCTIDQPQSQPLALPDTNATDGSQQSCTKDSDCPTSAPHCVITGDTGGFDGGPGFCAVSYVDTLNFTGFGQGATLDDPSKLLSVCATLEHSWFGDLQIELISPDGKTVQMRQFIGRTLATFFMGHANYCDSDSMPKAGVGYKYCWTASAATKILKPTSASATDPDGWTCGATGGCESWDALPTNMTCLNGNTDMTTPPYRVIPAGNYKPDVDFSALKGAQLNGAWTFRITDLWQIDNGFLTDWSIEFDSSLVDDCSTIIN